MKKILIFSDSHSDINRCIDIIRSAGAVHAVIHAGDCTSDAEDLSYIYPDIPIYYVKGNNDFFSNAPSNMTVMIDGVRIFIAHGHEERVKYESDYRTLKAKAKAASADLAVFGHTHISYISYDGGITAVNPGSIRFTATYAVAEIDSGKVNVKIMEY